MAEARQSTEDYCALLCRGFNKLYLINTQPAVVSVIQRCLEMFRQEHTMYTKSSSTTAFKLRNRPFAKGCCGQQEKTIGIKERSFIIIILRQHSSIYTQEMVNDNDE